MVASHVKHMGPGLFESIRLDTKTIQRLTGNGGESRQKSIHTDERGRRKTIGLCKEQTFNLGATMPYPNLFTALKEVSVAFRIS